MLPAAASTDAPPSGEAHELASTLYDQWFGKVIHEEFVVDVERRLLENMRQQAVQSLGGEEQAASCKGLDKALQRFASDDIRSLLEEAYTDPQTREAMIGALAETFPPDRMRGYLTTLSVKGAEDLVKVQIYSTREFVDPLKRALMASPLSRIADGESGERMQRAAQERIWPVVRRCKSGPAG
ncbi:hypothetical protein GCM10025759_10780 [Lysobacter panacisoli]|uniref:DUF2059 domain-containing protein n=1 Tax=Lysobacter panacisoli TaxID=1255263 RepID=A0ABP9L6Q4_9GAMM